MKSKLVGISLKYKIRSAKYQSGFPIAVYSIDTHR